MWACRALGWNQHGQGQGNYLQLPLQSTCVAGLPQGCLQGVGDHMAHAGLGCLLHLGCLDLQQQGTAHRGRDQLRIHEEEHSEGRSGGKAVLMRVTMGRGATGGVPSEPCSTPHPSYLVLPKPGATNLKILWGGAIGSGGDYGK